MKKIISIMTIIALTMVSCHRVYVGGGAAYPTGNGYVSVGGSVDTDDSGAAIVAASLLGILIGSAIYNDVHSYREKGLSAYDINIKPKDADIYLDGLYVGKADDFDGSPKFLVVKPGTHTITAKKPGYKTYTVRVSINPGEQINLNKHLEPAPVYSENKELVNNNFESPKVKKEENKVDKVFVRFNVRDLNAKVYLDDTFVGTIGEIKKLHKPLIVETTVNYIYIETKGAKIQFSLEKLIKEQGRHIVIDTQF
ncbi:hypothetical protein TTHT_1582 [Thermotomaculum hydrothermale]|uniref:PEGA domain-containing protein n=1 Tax=Thermotomaculum hydrothermale TaxID=981385 RepID=A0A7R6PUS5_9BACT|nr:PEGA domain-containing protein [Thermotomaculum hydrothermale]BBB33072.1 hypothetical protein TTHT_1582 [Thermotomaculum hydrothermale]